MYAINFKGILLVTSGFFWRNDPDAAFLGLANFPSIFLKSLLLINTSPRISISLGKLLVSIYSPTKGQILIDDNDNIINDIYGCGNPSNQNMGMYKVKRESEKQKGPSKSTIIQNCCS